MGNYFNAKNKIIESLKARVGGQAASVNNGKSSYPYLRALVALYPKAAHPASPISILGLIFAALLAPIFFTHSAYAETPALSFSASSASNSGIVELDTLSPTSTTGASTSGSDTLNITTTCSAGHSVYVSATSSGGTSLNNSDKTSSIPTSSAAIGSEAALSGNQWGVRYGSGSTFAGLPAYDSDIASAATALYTGTDTSVPIYYGVSVTPSLAPGEYSGEVLYTVVMASECEEEDAIPMQDWLGCPSLSVGEIVKLKDTRDNKVYRVKKLADNKCWMIDNLTLGSDTENYPTGMTLSSEDTNLTTKSSFYLPPAGKMGNSSDSLSDVNFGASDNLAHVAYAAKNSTDNAAGNPVPESSGYYNFYAATAGYSYRNDSKAYGTSPDDICPAGWRLPATPNTTTKSVSSAGLDNDFFYLADSFGSTSWVGSATGTNANPEANSTTDAYKGMVANSNTETSIGYAGFSFAGYYYSATLYDAGAYGYFWTSSIYSAGFGYVLRLVASYLSPQYSDAEYDGYAIRCISKLDDGSTTEPAGFMQDFDASKELTSIGQIATLVDKRDYQTYKVKRLADNKVWMIANLTLGSKGGLALTSDLTNMDSGQTLYLPKAGYQGSLTDSATPNSTTAVTFSSSNDNQARVSYKAKGSTDNNDGVAMPENTGHYNFYTATLGYSYYGDDKAQGSSPNDICPSSWRLPKVSDDGATMDTASMTNEYTYLANSYGATSWIGSSHSYHADSSSNAYTGMVTNNNLETSVGYAGFPYTGYYDANNKLLSAGSRGSFRSSSIGSSRFVYAMAFTQTYIYTQYGNAHAKTDGLAIRCLAQNDYTINYDSNGGTGEASKTSETAKDRTGNTITTASKNTLAKDGYTFKGWSTDASATTASYAENATVSLSSLLDSADPSTKSLTLYAVWEEVVSMQNWLGCPSLTVGQIVELTDTRDEKVYRVKKLADEKCWMIDNLTLGYDETQNKGVGVTLTPADTNISDGSTYYLPPAGYQGSLTDSDTLTSTTAASFSDSSSNQGKVAYASMGTTDNATYKTVPENTGYYNFYTATLGFSYFNDGRSHGTSSQDICPSGWRLPQTPNTDTQKVSSISSDNDFVRLANSLGSTSWNGLTTAASYNASSSTNAYKGMIETQNTRNETSVGYPGFTFAGHYDSDRLYDVGDDGYYWTSSIYNVNYGYSLLFQTQNIFPQHDGYKSYGYAIRCISNLDGIMQNYDASNLTSIGQIANLLDTRDNTIYRVKRLADNKVWMIDNLTLGSKGGVTMTQADTNVSDASSTYYLPTAGYQGSLTSSDTLTSTTAVDFSGADSLGKVAYAVAGTTNNNGNTVPENTGYYNFYTATLGFSYYNDGVKYGTSTQDICPSGWRLPQTPNTQTETISSVGSDNDFAYLSHSFGSTGWTGSTTSFNYRVTSINYDAYKGMIETKNSRGETVVGYPGFTFAGDYNTTTLGNVGTNGTYWTSSIYSTIYGYGLDFNSYGLYPQNHTSKNYGYAIRCVAK